MLKIFKSLFVVVAVAAIAGGATYALWNDEAKVKGVTVSSGTMDLKIDQNIKSGEENFVNEFNITSWDFRNVNGLLDDGNYNTFLKTVGLVGLYPGKTGVQIIDIKNVGDTPGIPTIDLNKISGSSELEGVLKFSISYDKDNNGSFDDTGLSGTVDQYTQAYDLSDQKLESGSKASVKIIWEMLSSADNSTQDKDLGLEVVFGLVQRN